MQDERKLFTPPEAARRAGVGLTKLRELVARRKIGCYRDGRKLSFGQQHIDAYLASIELKPEVNTAKSRAAS